LTQGHLKKNKDANDNLLLPLLLLLLLINKPFMMLKKPSMLNIWKEILLARFPIFSDLYLTLLGFDPLQIKKWLLHGEWKLPVVQCIDHMFSTETKSMLPTQKLNINETMIS
jgi:hypothetical protein